MGFDGPELEGLQPLELALSQGPRTDAGSESSKPQKVERGESKRPKLLTRAAPLLKTV